MRRSSIHPKKYTQATHNHNNSVHHTKLCLTHYGTPYFPVNGSPFPSSPCIIVQGRQIQKLFAKNSILYNRFAFAEAH